MSYMTPHAQCSPHPCRTSTLRATGRRAAMFLFFLAHLIISSGIAFAQEPCAGVSTITVNTGYDPVNGTTYPIGDVDGYWRVTSDETEWGIPLGELPRCADVIEPDTSWMGAQANSEWIASTPTYSNDSSYTTVFDRQFCIGVTPAPFNVTYNLSVLADDTASVYLDGVLIGTVANYGATTPTLINGMMSLFSGTHTLRVVLHNTGAVSAGINVKGTLSGLNNWFIPDSCCQSPCLSSECETDELILGTNSSWTILTDLDGGPTPRCASEIPVPPYSNWGPAIPGSTWIGMDNVGTGVTNGIYIFQKYFQVSQATTLQLKLSVMADDGVTVELDGNPILNYPNWAGSLPKVLDTLVRLEPGCHAFTFYVNNSGGIATGLDALIELLGQGLVKEECSTCPTCPDPCETDSYPLSTGYNPPLSSLYPIGTVDPYWHVIGDEAGGTVPRCANVIGKAYSWDSPEPGSQWIGTTPTADNPLNGRYIYERCFCMGDSGEVTIDIIVRADDHATIMLDGVLIGTNPPFGPINPTHIVHPVTLGPGKHCIQIAVYNTGYIHSGLNVGGEVYGDGLKHFNCCDDMLECAGDPINIQQDDLSGVEGTGSSQGATAMLRSIPNPTSGSTTIHYMVEKESMVTLDLYNAAGERIAGLLHERKKGGTYSLPYDAQALPAGIYYLRLTCGEKVTTVPMNVQ